jgi:hypothetical protein
MKRKPLFALSLALVGSAVLAQQNLPTVEVRADSGSSMVVACSNPTKPDMKDVERVLQITDSRQTRSLSKQLMAAADEGCKAGEPRILVTRSGTALKWEAMH